MPSRLLKSRKSLLNSRIKGLNGRKIFFRKVRISLINSRAG
jgi:hypothetical protein